MRMLTLDGGGVRGIIELVMLKELESAIGINAGIPLRAYFDLIVGTSTGSCYTGVKIL